MTVIVAAQRGLDLYLRIDADTGRVLNVGTGAEMPADPDIVHLATLDGASDQLDTYGWRAHYIPICGVPLPRAQLAALAHAIDTGDTARRDTILRHAGRARAA